MGKAKAVAVISWGFIVTLGGVAMFFCSFLFNVPANFGSEQKRCEQKWTKMNKNGQTNIVSDKCIQKFEFLFIFVHFCSLFLFCSMSQQILKVNKKDVNKNEQKWTKKTWPPPLTLFPSFKIVMVLLKRFEVWLSFPNNLFILRNFIFFH